MFRSIVFPLIFLAFSCGQSIAQGSHSSLSIGAGGERTFMTMQVQEILSAARTMTDEVTFRLRHTGGTYDNLKRLRTGEIGAAIVAVDALRGGDVPPNASLIWVMDGAPLILAVRADLGISDIRSLKGHRIISGGAGSALERLGPQVYSSLGANPEWRRSAWGQIAYQLRSRQADGFIASPKLFEAIRGEFGVPELKIVPLSSEDVHKLSSFDPDIKVSIVMVDGMPVSAWEIRSAIVSADSLPERQSEILAAASMKMSVTRSDGGNIFGWMTDGTVQRLGMSISPGSLKVLHGKRP